MSTYIWNIKQCQSLYMVPLLQGTGSVNTDCANPRFLSTGTMVPGTCHIGVQYLAATIWIFGFGRARFESNVTFGTSSKNRLSFSTIELEGEPGYAFLVHKGIPLSESTPLPVHIAFASCNHEVFTC